MMEWNKLICTIRLGLENYHDPKEQDRTEFQRDYDRLVFSAPFRRLQNKTQVFPLPGSIFVHNRLTHSLEVSSVGRSLGVDVMLCGHTHRGQIFPLNLLVDQLYEQSHGYRKWPHTHIWVSSGLSLWGPTFRIGTNSELAVIEISGV